MRAVLQGARQGAAHRAQEGQHPDQEEEAEQGQAALTLRLQHLHLQPHRQLEPRFRWDTIFREGMY